MADSVQAKDSSSSQGESAGGGLLFKEVVEKKQNLRRIASEVGVMAAELHKFRSRGVAREVQRPHKFSNEPPEPTVVQIKRKRTDEPIDSLWLEVTTVAKKRHTLGIQNLTVAREDSTPTKLLFRRVDSLSSSGVKELSLPKLLEKSQERKRSRDATENNHQLKKFKDQDIAKIARFEQMRTDRKAKEKTEEDVVSLELFNLYEVVRVDVEAESTQKAARREKARREAEPTEGQLLCNYLPLLREHLPELAAEIDATAATSSSTTTSTDVPVEEYIYDVYTLDEEMDNDDGDVAYYPTIQVIDHRSYDWRELNDSDYDSEDSNDEKNPNNDYPEEEGTDSEDCIDTDSSGYPFDDPYAQESEEYDASISDDDKRNRIWRPRK
ncbi:hypothetical protein R1flu_021073 [Riccia fluitans]|uniref:Probable RNA polymerase II nuclear localization protein SLC7A6OS n=1 Tax=Riccia fluitans TaxID=41844 RepID=A0ABD1ZNM8_9MARC